MKSYTGKIGLERLEFATTANGATTVATKQEYRDTYLRISATTAKLGEHYDAGSPSGSSRIKIDFYTGATTLTVFSTATTSADTGRPAVRIKAVNASNVIQVRSAPGGFGIAADAPGEVSTISIFTCTDPTTGSRCHLGAGVTCSAYTQTGGVNVLEAAATVSSATVEGGQLSTEGTFALTSLIVYDGVVASNSTGTITALTMYGGTVDFTGSRAARTVTTLNWALGGDVIAPYEVTMSSIVEPTREYKMSVSAT